MTKASATVCSCFRQAGELGLEQPADFLVGHAARTQLLDGGGDNRLAGADRARFLLASGDVGDERACALAQLDDPLVLEITSSSARGRMPGS
jgi:hypothetical protein